MKKETIMCELFDFSVATYYKRKKNNNLAIKFIENYFTNEEINEFIQNQSISKLNSINTIYPIAFQEYTAYIKKVVEISDNLIISTHPNQVKDLESYLFTSVPIFIFFEYICESNSDFSYNKFTSDILKILQKYRINLEEHDESIQVIFKMKESLLDIFFLFAKDKKFDLYYKYSESSIVYKHSLFFELYHKIKNIQKNNHLTSEINKELHRLFSNIEYEEKRGIYIIEGNKWEVDF